MWTYSNQTHVESVEMVEEDDQEEPIDPDHYHPRHYPYHNRRWNLLPLPHLGGRISQMIQNFKKYFLTRPLASKCIYCGVLTGILLILVSLCLPSNCDIFTFNFTNGWSLTSFQCDTCRMTLNFNPQPQERHMKSEYTLEDNVKSDLTSWVTEPDVHILPQEVVPSSIKNGGTVEQNEPHEEAIIEPTQMDSRISLGDLLNEVEEIIFGETIPPPGTTTTRAIVPSPQDGGNQDIRGHEVYTNVGDNEEYIPSENFEETTKLAPILLIPSPFMQCTLAYHPIPDPNPESVSMEEGILFGNFDNTSRLEYMQDSDSGFELNCSYSIDFKTGYPHGLIFMWLSLNRSSNDFVALYLKNGYIHFSFDSGSGQALLSSSNQVNDSDWHSVTFSRNLSSGTLIVDGVEVASGNSTGKMVSINAGTTIYVGGLPAHAWGRRDTLRKIQEVDSPFRGCLKNFMLGGGRPGIPIFTHCVHKCSSSSGLESGVYFYPNGGYLKMHNRFVVGTNIRFSLSIKPRHPSGILVAVHGNVDFMLLQMVNGTIKFTVDNGRGLITTTAPKEPYELCDGNWHTIRVFKSRSVVNLNVDGVNSSPGIGSPRRESVDTNHPLFVGGLPDPNPDRVRGLETTNQYVGCMKDFSVEGRELKLGHDAIQGTVALHSCPTD